MKKKCYLLVVLILQLSASYAQQLLPYKNQALSTDERVRDLLSRMTIEEKFWQLFMIPGDLGYTDSLQYANGIFGFQVSAVSKGDPGGQLLSYGTSENAPALVKKINSIQKYFVEHTRLGIPIIAFDEALHGVVREGATAFPQAIALAATWDTGLMHRVASAIAWETKARGIRDILTPVVNIASDVRWGRTEETYGEDPYLVSEMAVAFVGEFEKIGIITTPKHFIANVGDGGRDSYPVNWNERLLDEIYLPPFKACILRGGSRSVMTAYNSLNAIPSSSNNWLLMKKLKGDWRFRGFIISDANAVGGDVVLHHTAKSYAEAGSKAINNGLDVIFQTDYNHYKLFIPSFLNGTTDTNRINDAVSRVLKAKFELGLFESPYVPEDAVQQLLRDHSHKDLARKAALESIVLLKNDRNALPFDKSIKSIAVVGEEAIMARLGGYSGPGNNKINIVDGITQRAGHGIKVTYTKGAGIKSDDYAVIPPQFLGTADGSKGLQAEYFNNVTLSGAPAFTRIDSTMNFQWTLSAPDERINADFYSARWTGVLRSPVTGRYRIGLEGNDGFRLFINNKMVIDKWEKQTYGTYVSDYYFEKGKKYNVRLEFFEPNGNAHLKLIWNATVVNTWQQEIRNAVTAVQKADVAVVTVGIHEGEFQDRAMLSLPAHQEDLISAIAATGKKMIVLLVGGSAVTMSNWLHKADGVACIWYPGEEGGHAVADFLFGDYNPAGRLPVTFPVHEAQLPLVYNHMPTGRGDDYNNLSGLPLFPFGYGLSYTTFEYAGMRLDKDTIGQNDSTLVRCMIKNTGNRDGDEVVQLYIKDVLASVARPVIELKGFQRVHLKAGETKEILFSITPSLLQMLNEKLEYVTEPGDFRIMIGASSRNIRAKQNLTVKE